MSYVYLLHRAVVKFPNRNLMKLFQTSLILWRISRNLTRTYPQTSRGVWCSCWCKTLVLKHWDICVTRTLLVSDWIQWEESRATLHGCVMGSGGSLRGFPSNVWSWHCICIPVESLKVSPCWNRFECDQGGTFSPYHPTSVVTLLGVEVEFSSETSQLWLGHTDYY